MRFLADESCDMTVVRALQSAGHDVVAVRERQAGLTDVAVARIAKEEKRILITEDKDFGQLVHAATDVTAGVILLRFPRNARSEIGRAAMNAITVLGERLKTAFVVVEPGRFRITER